MNARRNNRPNATHERIDLMRRLALSALLATTVVVLAGCAPSLDDRRATVQETIENIDGVDAARVDAFEAAVTTDSGLSTDASLAVLQRVRAALVDLDAKTAPAYMTVGIAGPDDRRWIGEWRFAAVDENAFDQQAEFIAGLSEWEGINAADAPLARITLEVGDPDPDSFVSIQAYQMPGGASEEVRAELLDQWVQSGGDPDVYIHWRGRP